MISQLLLASDPPNSPANIVERTKQVQQAASMAFKDICVGGKHHLQEIENLIGIFFSGAGCDKQSCVIRVDWKMED